MRRFYRFFPVSQDINMDPEVLELIRLFGERMLRVWLEMLSIADRNDGVLKGTIESWAKSLLWVYWAGNPRWHRRDLETLQRALRWMSETGWIAIREGSRDGSEAALVIVNYWKYHKTPAQMRDRQRSAPNLTTPNLILYRNKESGSGLRPAPSADLKTSFSSESNMGRRSQNLSVVLKTQTDRLFNSDPERYKRQRMAAWIEETRIDFKESDMAEAISQLYLVRDDVEDWYPWLDKVVEGIDGKREKAEEKARVDEFEREHERRKALEREFSKQWNLAKGIFGDAKKKS
jgi:hypothetical protein